MSNETPEDLINASPAMDAGSRALAQIRNLQRALSNALDSQRKEPQHEHPEPWREHGFERCTEEEAKVSASAHGVTVRAWNLTGSCEVMLVRGHDAGAIDTRCHTPIRPSAEKGLREAIALLDTMSAKAVDAGDDGKSDAYDIAAVALKRVIDKRYPPPVCGECGRAR
jgi:hypothetical protein